MSEPDPVRRSVRADARRNHDRILAVAVAAIAEHGADASLEEIARRAGVGSATLHRHFPTRQALLEAVFRDRVLSLCGQAGELAAGRDPWTALVTWLRAVGGHASTHRGLAVSLLRGGRESPSCRELILRAGDGLLDRARAAGVVRADVRIADLLTLVNAISLATEHQPAEADRLLTLAIDGVRPVPSPNA